MSWISYYKFDELDKLKCKFGELDKLKDKSDELDGLKDEFDELAKLNCKLKDELAEVEL